MFMMEMLGTCGLVTVIMGLKFHTAPKEGIVAAFIVGLTLICMITWTGGITGGCLNPAVGIANTVFQTVNKNALSDPSGNTYENLTTKSLWIYILGPLCGGALGGGFMLFNTTVVKRDMEAAAKEEANYEGGEKLKTNNNYVTL